MNEAELLTVLLHEFGNPLFTAMLELDRLRASLRRLVRVQRVFGIVQAELAGDRERLPPFYRRTVAKAVASLKADAASVETQLSRGIGVMVATGALDAVLHNLIDNAHRHAPGATVTVRAYQLAQGEQPWPDGSQVTLRGSANPFRLRRHVPPQTGRLRRGPLAVASDRASAWRRAVACRFAQRCRLCLGLADGTA